MHMTPKEAAAVAKKAQVKKLLLTHFSPDNSPDCYLDEAKDVFEDVECAEMLKQYII